MIRLRPYKHSDNDYLKRWITSERLCNQWCATNFTYPLDDIQMEKYYHSLEKSENDFSFTAISESEEQPVGHIKIGKIDFDKKQGVLQFVLIGDEYRGKGYGKELVRLAVTYAFEILKLNKVMLNVFAFNQSAVHCYKKMGFKEIQHREKSYPFKDELWDTILMELVKA